MNREDFYAMHADFVQDDWNYLECDLCGKELKRTYLQCGADNNDFGTICRKCFIKGDK